METFSRLEKRVAYKFKSEEEYRTKDKNAREGDVYHEQTPLNRLTGFQIKH